MKKGVPMTIVKATAKGPILIPAPIRKKRSIGKGTILRISREGNRILVEPMQKDVVEVGRGMLKSRGCVLKALSEDRKAEANGKVCLRPAVICPDEWGGRNAYSTPVGDSIRSLGFFISGKGLM
jgi:AbrB family looped-hinge helix DNA binding protein